MIFIFKDKPIHLDCFTSAVRPYEYAPIAPATRFIPQWWKDIPKGTMNMRKCSGFIDLYSKGVMLPLWSDLKIDLDGNGGYIYLFADKISSIQESKPLVESGAFMFDSKVTHVKIRSPWFFSCKDDIDWHFAQPMWNHNAGQTFNVPTGVLNYKYQNATEINVLFRNDAGSVSLEHGTPMAHIIPLSERPLKVHNHLISDAEYRQFAEKNTLFKFSGSYFKRVKLLKEKESKCPFGFGGNT